MDYNSYLFDYEADMLYNKVIRALYNIYSLALKQRSVFEIEALNIERCRRYDEAGHKA